MSGNILVSAGSGRRTMLRLVLSLAGTVAAVYLLWPVIHPLLERVHVEPMWGIENMTAIARSALMAVGAYVVFSLLSYCFERLAAGQRRDRDPALADRVRNADAG